MMRRIIATLLLLLAGTVATAQVPFPQTLPANTVYGRLGIGPGPGQAIPFSRLTTLALANSTTVSVKNYGAVCDGVTNDAAAINAAVFAVGQGVVEFPPGSCAIASTVVIRQGTLLRGLGRGGPHVAGATSQFSTRLLWTGSAGGTMVDMSPTTGAAAPAISGGGVVGMSLECNTTAATGIQILSVREATFDLYIDSCTTVGMKMGVVATLGDYRDTQRNVVTLISRQSPTTAGVGLEIDGDATANTSVNYFPIVHIQESQTREAINCKNADSNNFGQTHIFAGGGAPPAGIILRAGGAGQSCRGNVFMLMEPGPHGLTAEGTASGVDPSQNNNIFQFNETNGASPPTTGIATSLCWRSDIAAGAAHLKQSCVGDGGASVTGPLTTTSGVTGNNVAVTGATAPTIGINAATANTLNLYTRGLISTQITSDASAVNFPSFIAKATGNPVIVGAAGSDTNISYILATKGTGSVDFRTDTFGTFPVQFSVTHTASANRNIAITGSNGGNPAMSTSAGGLAINPSNGHILPGGGSQPTASACAGFALGTGSSDTAGRVAYTSATTCVINFGTAFTNAPFCNVTPATAASTVQASTTTSQLSVSFGTAQTVFAYHCFGS